MTEYIKTNNIRDILKGAVTELLKKQPKNARTFLGQWIGQAQQIDTTRLMLVSSDTPDRADFLDMVKCLKAQYAFETQTPGELVAIIRALVAAHGKFKSIALASHGPASAESTWAISSKAVVDMADQKSEGFKVLEALAEAVQTGGRVDLLACNLIASPEGKSFLKDLEDRTGCNFAASVDKTGNPQDATTDWIMESDNVDIRDFYFTNTALFDGSFEETTNSWHAYCAKSKPVVVALSSTSTEKGSAIIGLDGTLWAQIGTPFVNAGMASIGIDSDSCTVDGESYTYEGSDFDVKTKNGMYSNGPNAIALVKSARCVAAVWVKGAAGKKPAAAALAGARAVVAELDAVGF